MHISGWIVPVKDGKTKYPLNSNTIDITTESNTDSSDEVNFKLYGDSVFITNIIWRFSDWGCVISRCTPWDYSIKFTSLPTNVTKTWEITVTPEDIRIKCNTLEVLYFIFDRTYKDDCTTKVKGKIASRIKFSSEDTATKMFELVGK